MPLNPNRIRADIEAIAGITETPGNGATRPTFSPEWGRARDYVIGQATAAGCDIRIDAAGNVHARPKTLGWDSPAWLCGSHIDTVPHGGDYDGVAGVVVSLELLRSAAEDRVASFPLELIVFAEEEGPTFGLGMIGSRLWVGELDPAWLAELRNVKGQNYIEAGQTFGVDVARIVADRIAPSKYLGLLEVHIEQGPGMWRRDQRLAVVTAIAGRRQYQVSVRGEANHAGATAMTDRRDALVAAAEILVALESLAPRLSPEAVITVGRLVSQPNAVNVIPDRVDFTIDLRAPDDALLRQGDHDIRNILNLIQARRGVRIGLEQTEAAAARPMDAKLVDQLRRVSGNAPLTVSGALHDSAILAPHVPTVMLFVPSRDGISHNPAEFSRIEDIAAAASVVERFVRRPTLENLNAMKRESFVSALGGIFEHSPWIAEKASDRRPFDSVADLHQKMCAVVRAAGIDSQIALIRAHPDLVGRLAREVRLTQESTSEQAAAGLSELSPEEAATFDRFNDAYREQFGFPFVICARENRKDAILAAFPRRLKNNRDLEIAAALTEIDKIARLRLSDAIWED